MALEIRKTLFFNDEIWSAVMDYRFENRMNTEADAIRNLIMAGLHYYKLMQDDDFAVAEQKALERMNATGVQGGE